MLIRINCYLVAIHSPRPSSLIQMEINSTATLNLIRWMNAGGSLCSHANWSCVKNGTSKNVVVFYMWCGGVGWELRATANVFGWGKVGRVSHASSFPFFPQSVGKDWCTLSLWIEGIEKKCTNIFKSLSLSRFLSCACLCSTRTSFYSLFPLDDFYHHSFVRGPYAEFMSRTKRRAFELSLFVKYEMRDSSLLSCFFSCQSCCASRAQIGRAHV